MNTTLEQFEKDLKKAMPKLATSARVDISNYFEQRLVRSVNPSTNKSSTSLWKNLLDGELADVLIAGMGDPETNTGGYGAGYNRSIFHATYAVRQVTSVESVPIIQIPFFGRKTLTDEAQSIFDFSRGQTFDQSGQPQAGLDYKLEPNPSGNPSTLFEANSTSDYLPVWINVTIGNVRREKREYVAVVSLYEVLQLGHGRNYASRTDAQYSSANTTPWTLDILRGHSSLGQELRDAVQTSFQSLHDISTQFTSRLARGKPVKTQRMITIYNV